VSGHPQSRAADDYYHYVNGAWLETIQIPSGRAAYGAVQALNDRTERQLLEIIESCHPSVTAPGGPASKLFTLYESFMDTNALEAHGIEPLVGIMEQVSSISTGFELAAVMGSLQRHGSKGLFSLSVQADRRNSHRNIAYLGQSGLGLPDERFYRDPECESIRSKYASHIAIMLGFTQVAGFAVADPHDGARRILAVETAIASTHWDLLRCRDDEACYTRLTRRELEAMAPSFCWEAWLEGARARPSLFGECVVKQPEFLAAGARALAETPLADLRLWLAWHAISSAAPYLSADIAEAHFTFYGRTIPGNSPFGSRQKRAIAEIQESMGHAIGQLYLERHFQADTREQALEIVNKVILAYHELIDHAAWMTMGTKQLTHEKLSRITVKIGGPICPSDYYDSLRFDHGSLLDLVRTARAFNFDQQMAKSGTEVVPLEWEMLPQSVNAYYSTTANAIEIPAAILQRPFFDAMMKSAENYGGIGAIVGHEITHAFDSQGSLYDCSGNIGDWWTESDRAAFSAITSRIAEQFDGLAPRDLPGHYVNGALTADENIGDLCGITVAVAAWRLSKGKLRPSLAELRLLFANWARIWAAKIHSVALIQSLATSPHAPNELRVNTVRNLDDFYEAFGLHEGDGLWLEPGKRVRIW
jgi:putative endopeptidase